MAKVHTFHVPVLGIGYSIDTPLKISHYGMDSVISLVDDILLEKLRKLYCGKNNIPYREITDKEEDYRALRIMAYLDLLKDLSEKKFDALKKSVLGDGIEIREFFHMMPDNDQRKQAFNEIISDPDTSVDIISWLDDNLRMGSIDVNIMTKLDRENYLKGEKLSHYYNDAHAALRGYALSALESTLVLSAGINPRLYTYMQEFEDFYPDENGYIQKKIALKVSDYKSALIQGKFLAKRGLWVSEYRIESGLNCGGHAFATEGYLMGPILAEFRDRHEELVLSNHEIIVGALSESKRTVPSKMMPLKITAQGGVGTAEEHQFLIDEYGVDSVGWGTPFLLVPEATTIDDATLDKLMAAKENDLYLSDISPLGVPFNSLRGNTKDLEKLARIAAGKPGSSCSKKYASLSTEFSDKTICLASRRYQSLKLKELSKQSLSPDEYNEQYAKIVDKSCICTGLGTANLLVNNLNTRIEGDGVSVCPGPNMAYFSRAMSLKEITDHIYGRANFMSRKDRPNMFVKEIWLYLDYLEKKIKETGQSAGRKQIKYFLNFTANLAEGLEYYNNLFTDKPDDNTKLLSDLKKCEKQLMILSNQAERLSENFKLVTA